MNFEETNMNYIIFPGEINLRKGGPSGYIANLSQGLQSIGAANNVNIISEEKSLISSTKSRMSKLKNFIGKSELVTEYLMAKKSVNLRDISIKQKLEDTTFNANDLLHVHNVMDYHSLRKYNLSSKVLLTPHTPESVADEFVNVIRNNYNNQSLKLKKYWKTIKDIEDQVFRDCQYFMFPSEEAMGIYKDFVKDFDKVIKDKKVFFNLTGSKPLNFQFNREEFRRKLNIDNDAFVISYIGRHDAIKGFDLLNEVAKAVYKIDPKIVFLSGGTGPIKSDSPNFIQMGWTDDPGSIVNCSDLFILPNKNTYFDLVLLEVLSLGTPVLASNTGGNKTISKLSDGVVNFESNNLDEIIRTIFELKEREDLLVSMRHRNKQIFELNFTLDKFAGRYLKVLNDINNNI